VTKSRRAPRYLGACALLNGFYDLRPLPSTESQYRAPECSFCEGQEPRPRERRHSRRPRASQGAPARHRIDRQRPEPGRDGQACDVGRPGWGAAVRRGPVDLERSREIVQGGASGGEACQDDGPRQGGAGEWPPDRAWRRPGRLGAEANRLLERGSAWTRW
jgi:hypothetical protein